MDKKIQILLGSQKNVTSVNVDTYDKIEFFNKESEIIDYNINDAVNSSDVFETERENNAIYRIYGKIEYLSLLNGLASNYTKIQDFLVLQTTGNTKNLLNSFNFYLVKPSTGYTNTIYDNIYIRYFEVIATPNDFELFPAGFSNNVYGEQNYAFTFKKDIDVSNYFDNFGFPITELFLYAKYIPTQNGFTNSIVELLRYNDWQNNGIPIKTVLDTTTPLTIGSRIYGDLIEYNQSEFLQTQLSGQTYSIKTTCYDVNNLHINLVWKYNPFIPLRLRYFSNDISTANTGSTSYDILSSIPDYAIPVDNVGNLVWRDILPQGYIDPLTGIGVDYPFVNGKRYLFSTNILSVSSDMSDVKTQQAFSHVWFSKNASSLNIIPTNNLSDIGKPCL